MLNLRPISNNQQRGSSLLEVLVTIIILTFGLLGLAGLQAKIQLAEMESYQRSQAVLLLSDMTERISSNRGNAVNYVVAGSLGTGDAQPASCVGAGAARDLCEWSNGLKGAAEKTSSNSSGAMIGARGCITEVQAPDTTPTVCTPGIYQVTVVWQGLNPTSAPGLNCGKGSYDKDAYRRAISSQVTVGLPLCS